jgi:hypothetical protein
MMGVFLLREVVLLQKVYSEASLKEFRGFLEGLCEGLKVDLKELSKVENGWVRARVSGEDERVALNLLEKEVGLAPVSAENVERFSMFRGRMVHPGRSKLEVFVDVGVFLPEPVFAILPLWKLQGQLVDGRKVALERLVGLFGFVDGFPLEVRIIDDGVGGLNAELTEGQLGVFDRWMSGRMDRLIVLGVSAEAVGKAVRRAGVGRDVVGVESLGFLEHVVVCKLGTDGAGLVPRLGRRLKEAKFVVFCPRLVLGLLS